MRRILMVALLLTMTAVCSAADPPNELREKLLKGTPKVKSPAIMFPDVVSGEVGAFIPIYGDTEGKKVRFIAVTPGLSVFPPDLLANQKATVVLALDAGDYELIGYTAVGDEPSDPAKIIVRVSFPASKKTGAVKRSEVASGVLPEAKSTNIPPVASFTAPATFAPPGYVWRQYEGQPWRLERDGVSEVTSTTPFTTLGLYFGGPLASSIQATHVQTVGLPNIGLRTSTVTGLTPTYVLPAGLLGGTSSGCANGACGVPQGRFRLFR